MGTVGRIFKDAADSVIHAATHSKRLQGVTDNLGLHIGNVGRRTDGIDVFDGKPDMPNGTQNPPIDRTRNPDWLNNRLDRDDLPFWRRRMAEGDQFNYQNHHRYPQNEVTLENGKRLDSYDPGVEIVSRKNTQLDGVKPETANSYIDEILNKYSPDERISGSDGEMLDGDLILEVPVQNGDVPQSVIDHANSKDPRVTIRDVLGNEYN